MTAALPESNVDPGDDLLTELRREGHRPILLCPGPPSREGGQYYAVWAAALLQQLHPNVRLIVPGHSTERARLERFVRSFRLPDILVCPPDGWATEPFLAVADVFVVPAIRETPVDSIHHAMTAGVPVVACDLPGIRRFVEDGVSGLLVPAGKPARLAGAILRLIEDQALRRQIVTSALAHAKRHGESPVSVKT